MLVNIRSVIIVTTVILCLYVFTNSLWAISGENTYVFAVSACSPWKTKLLEKHAKDVAYACKNDVWLFTSSVKKALDIPSENIFTLLDEQATYEGLQRGLSEFADNVPEGSRVIMLFNFHGYITDISPEDKPVKDEVLVLWTEDKPFTMLSALALKQWVTATELRGMIDQVQADEIIITVDSCHSGGAVPDILKKHGRDKHWQGREAVIMSSKADQFSYFTMDGTHGLFTLKLSESIGSDFPNLMSAFENAVKETIEYLEKDIYQKKCAEMLWETIHKKENCEQIPITYDPTELLQSIKLKSKSQANKQMSQ